MAARLTTYLVVGIVAATFIAGLIGGAQRDDYEGPVDLIVHNASVFTADGDGATAEAVAIRGNQILRVGSNREINRLRRPQTTMIDAGGATVLPGFNDSNVRLVKGGLSLLHEAREAEEPGSAAPAPGVTREERLDAVRAAVAEAHRHGVTSVHDVGATPADIAMYDELRRSGELALRVYAALEIDGPFDEGLLTRLAAIWKDFSDDPRFKTGAVALDLDGPDEGGATSLEARGRDPRPPLPSADIAASAPMDADELNRFVRLLDAQGWQILADASTGQAVSLALDAYRHAERSNAKPPRGRRHRIEGADAPREADLERFSALGVIASVQPGSGRPGNAAAALETSDAPLVFGSGWPSAPINPLLGLQAAVAGLLAGDGDDGRKTGDDEPALAVHLARQPEDAQDLRRQEPRQVAGMPLEAAVNAYTAGGAYASFDEQRKGTIGPGMLADLVVLSDDIFAVPTERLTSTTVAITIFDGRVVYRRETRSTNSPTP